MQERVYGAPGCAAAPGTAPWEQPLPGSSSKETQMAAWPNPGTNVSGVMRHCCPRTSSPGGFLVTRVTKSHCQDEKPMVFLTKQLLPSKAARISFKKLQCFKKHCPHRGTAETFIRGDSFCCFSLPKPPALGRRRSPSCCT